MYVEAKIQYTTGEIETKTLFTIARIAKGETICIPSGVLHSGIHREDRIIDSYTILLKNVERTLRNTDRKQNSIAFAKYEKLYCFCKIRKPYCFCKIRSR